MPKIRLPPSILPLPKFGETSVFLAGSIEMGKAEDWQTRVIAAIHSEIPEIEHIFNPRRNDWDSSWEQSIDNQQFFDQVSWEQQYILADNMVVFFYFAPGTISPISLLELGQCLEAYQKMIVVCPHGFHRKGNVDIVCQGKADVYLTLDDGIAELKNYFKNRCTS